MTFYASTNFGCSSLRQWSKIPEHIDTTCQHLHTYYLIVSSDMYLFYNFFIREIYKLYDHACQRGIYQMETNTNIFVSHFLLDET